jgi:hypothetical protein
MDQLGTWQTTELNPYLVRFGRRLRLRDGWLLAQRSFWMPVLAAVLIQLAGRIWPIANLASWTLGPLALWLVVLVAFSLLRPLPAVRVARRCDAELGLKERLATALMLEGAATGQLSRALVVRQRQDALAVARQIEPRRAFPLPWLQRPLLLAAALVAATVALALLPNRMDAVLAQRAEVARAAEEQAKRIDELRQQIETAQELTPEEREELLRRLSELAKQLRANAGDREQALADLSRVEEALRQKLDPNADARQAALEALAAQLQALAQNESGGRADPAHMDETLEALAENLAGMDQAEREALAQSLSQMAARAAQAGDMDLAQALAALAQAAQSGDMQAASDAAQSAAQAMAQAQGELAGQDALQRALSQLQQSRQAMSQAGQGQGQGTAQAPGQGQGQGQGQSQGQGQGQSQGGQGQSQGGQGTGGQGTKADRLPPGTGTGQARRPQGEGQPGDVVDPGQQVYVPWERRQGSGDEVSIPGQDTGQGDTQVRERRDPLPGTAGEALLPYHEVYYEYLDTANQAMEQSYIPAGLKDYVRAYFSQLEP